MVEIRLTVEVEAGGEPYLDVSTELLFEPELPEALQDKLHQHLYDGVHGGIAIAVPPVALPLTIKILELCILPHENFTLEENVEAVGSILEAQMVGIVATLCSSMPNISSQRL